MRKAVLSFMLLAAVIGVSAAKAQTCGGSLSCNISGTSYTITNNTGNGFEGEQGGVCTSVSGVPLAGVLGASLSNDGVVGYTNVGVAGVAGYNMVSSVCPSVPAAGGLLGVRRSSVTWGVFAEGDIGATGTKSFIEPHPTDPTKEIRYVSLEGPEAGTYFRGTGRTHKGFATIEVPDSFRMVTAERGLTVVVTPVGELAQVAAISKGLDKIVIQSSKDVTFDYVVNGVRKAFQDFQPIAKNEDFVPNGPDDNRFFTLPAESQRRLVATGIYTPDGKVNLDKAREMGWDLQWAQHQAPSDLLARLQQHR
ncbi:MAG TPA: hypothetical protein VIE43_19555 [Thermoanaerobaculia bacterium]|jgi:uncharacterized membrane protein|nr:hypothetical protein [Thermoanaerobaculia bacterium]